MKKEAGVKIRLKLIFFTLLALTGNFLYGQPKGRIFVLEDSMIQSFDVILFEVTLTEAAKKQCRETDFSAYNFIGLTDTAYVFPLIETTMSFRPSEIFVYRKAKQITTKTGTLRFMASHLRKNDQRLLGLKEYCLPTGNCRQSVQ